LLGAYLALGILWAVPSVPIYYDVKPAYKPLVMRVCAGALWAFTLRGPVYTNLLLADEINRATPKTQAALLEVMQEQQVTIEGERFALEPPFLAIATQNPLELEGTYPLPEAQLDRFLMR
jgi:hypothetical protein